MNGFREKYSGSERQLNVMVDLTAEYKNKFKVLESTISKLAEELKACKMSNNSLIQE